MQRIIRIDRQAVIERNPAERRPPPDGSRPAVSSAPVELEILRGNARQLRRAITVPVFLIGTASDCDLVLGDDAMPEVHTYLYLRPDGVTIRTLGAEPPLKVGGQTVETLPLHDGDRFSIGPFEFRVHIAPLHQPPVDRGRRNRSFCDQARADRGENTPGLADARDLIDGAVALGAELRVHIERQAVVISSAGWRRMAGRATA